jgi:hypothetical protein
LKFLSLEANMNVQTIYSALALAALLAIAQPTLSQAQSADTTTSVRKPAAAPTGTAASSNVRANPRKHRYWRHRGGSHPHYGSRRVRT